MVGGVTDSFTSENDAAKPISRRKRLGFALLVAALAGTAALAWVPAPYVIEMPGPVYDTLGTVTASDDSKVPMVQISGTETYETSGSLSLLTVWVAGSPESRPSWFEVFEAWVRPDYAIMPIDAIYPSGITQEDSANSNKIAMSNSKQEAVAAAFKYLEIPYESEVAVDSTMQGYPAAGLLKENDIVVMANGVNITVVSGLRAEIAKVGVDKEIELTVLRDGETLNLKVGIKAAPDDNKTPVVGILTKGIYRFPFEVNIQLDNVGGSSAGMMFALGIIDQLTPGSLTGGAYVAGTGEISADGTVGEIGGVVQKAYAARDAGAKWMLVPSPNCDELALNIPDGLRTVRIETLTDSMNALKAIRAHSGTSTMPSCLTD